MRKVMCVMAVSLMVVAAGCGVLMPLIVTQTPEARLLAAREQFNTTVNVLCDIVEAGDVLDTPDAIRVLELAKRGGETLDLIEVAVLEGKPTSTMLDDFNAILRKLVAERALAEEKRRKAVSNGR